MNGPIRRLGIAVAAMTAAALCACGNSSAGSSGTAVTAQQDAAQCTIAGLDLDVRALAQASGAVSGGTGLDQSFNSGVRANAPSYALDCMRKLGYSCNGNGGQCTGHGQTVAMSKYFGY